MHGNNTSPEWNTFYQQHLQFVNALAVRSTRCPEDAEDVGQEVMLRAYNAIKEMRMGDNTRAWLTVVLKHVVIDFYRKYKNRPSFVTLEFDPIQKNLAPDPTSDWIDPLHWLAPYLENLPDWGGELIRTGMKHDRWDEEFLAAKLGKTPGSVRTGLFKMRGILLDSFGWGEVLRLMREYDIMPAREELGFSLVDMVLAVEERSQRDPDVRSRMWNDCFEVTRGLGPVPYVKHVDDFCRIQYERGACTPEQSPILRELARAQYQLAIYEFISLYTQLYGTTCMKKSGQHYGLRHAHAGYALALEQAEKSYKLTEQLFVDLDDDEQIFLRKPHLRISERMKHLSVDLQKFT